MTNLHEIDLSVAADSRALRVLVVDEDESITGVLALALKFEGWVPEVAASGEQAIRSATMFEPDVILLDMMLPDITGVDVAAQLRANGVHAPIVFLTGRDSIDDRMAAYAAGGDEYVTKPFGLDEVVARIRTVLPA